MKLDHIVWASNSLDEAAASFERLSGVEAGAGGRHIGIGSRNALANLENGAYLAIDGPDPEQELVGNYGAFLASLTSPVLWRFVLQTSDLAAAEAVLTRHGYQTAIKSGSRTTTRGELLEWDTLSVLNHDLGSGMPMIKTWRTNSHPSTEAPAGCRLIKLTVSHPKTNLLKNLYDDLGINIELEQASEPALTAVIEGRSGRFTLPVA